MTPRPKNPPPDRRQEILDAALRIFAEKGYNATTNADIARAAGVTPAALYYYFRSKEELFRAAIAERQVHVKPIIDQMTRDLTDADPRQVLPEVIRHVTNILTEERTQAVMRIVLSEGPRNPAVTRIWEELILAMISMLFPYLEHQMAQDRIRRMDPRVFVLTLHGPILTTVILRDLLKAPMMQGLTNEMLVDQLTRTTLQSLLTTTP